MNGEFLTVGDSREGAIVVVGTRHSLGMLHELITELLSDPPTPPVIQAVLPQPKGNFSITVRLHEP